MVKPSPNIWWKKQKPKDLLNEILYTRAQTGRRGNIKQPMELVEGRPGQQTNRRAKPNLQRSTSMAKLLPDQVTILGLKLGLRIRDAYHEVIRFQSDVPFLQRMSSMVFTTYLRP